MKSSKLYTIIQSIKHPITTYNRFIDSVIEFETNRLKKVEDYQELLYEEFGNGYKETFMYSFSELRGKIISLKIEMFKSLRKCYQNHSRMN